MKILKILLILIIFIVIFLLIPQKTLIFQEKIITIERGETSFNIAFKLKDQGIINNPYFFLLNAFLKNNIKTLQAGEYLLNSKMTNDEIINIL